MNPRLHYRQRVSQERLQLHLGGWDTVNSVTVQLQADRVHVRTWRAWQGK